MARPRVWFGLAVLLVSAWPLETGRGDGQGFATVRVTVGPNGEDANGDSFGTSISADGRFVAFGSAASNLVAGDTGGLGDVFVRGLLAGVTERISVGPGGVEANGHSGGTAISADGRFVAYASQATNLAPGDTDSRPDVYVLDRSTVELEVVTTGVADRTHWPRGLTVSADGNRVAFAQHGLWLWDRAADTVQVAARGEDPVLSSDGRFLAWWTGNTLLHPEAMVFVRDLETGETEIVSLGRPGGSLSPSLSADGRFVAFLTFGVPVAAGLDVVVVDRDALAGVLAPDSLLGVADGYEDVSLSADGRYVAFAFTGGFTADDGIPCRDLDSAARGIYRWDRASGTIKLMTPNMEGAPSLDAHLKPKISGNGAFVVFASRASDLVAGDANGLYDVYVRDARAPSLDCEPVGAVGP